MLEDQTLIYGEWVYIFTYSMFIIRAWVQMALVTAVATVDQSILNSALEAACQAN